ncbi:tetratricopeptide repeat protein [Nocardioides pakistanensis]
MRPVTRVVPDAVVQPDRPADSVEDAATAQYAAGDLEGTVTTWEQEHARRIAVGDDLAAAHAAAMVALYLLMDTGLMAPVRGWLSRCEGLLAGHGETPVHALVAMLHAYERFMCGDLEAAERWAGRAVALGDRYDVVPASALGRVAAARVRILTGEVSEGLAHLDEAAVTLLSDQVDPLTAGMVWCELVCAMQGLAEYDRAAEWTAVMETRRARGDFYGGINGRCRIHRAELLRLHGRCDEAEQEALHACEELRPWMRREFGWPLTELGTIRLRRGDLDGAEEAFRAAHATGWQPQPGWALLRLARGRVAEAAAMVRDALVHPRQIPWKERPPNVALSRAPLLDAQVEIALAAGDPSTARAAATELATIAATYPGPALHAMAELARGRVALADSDAAAAIDACGAAVHGWCTVDAPYETALARMVLAEAHRAAGDDALAALELDAARRALEGIGATAPADLAHDDRGDAPSVATPEPATEVGVFKLDGDTRTVTFLGTTVLLRDLKGMHHLTRLLTAPGREFHVLDLVSGVHGVTADSRPGIGLAPEDGLRLGADDAGPLLDDQARRAYRRRLTEVDEDIAEAEEMGDLERASLARADRDHLVAELARAFGLGGRERRSASGSERARVSVTRAIRYTLTRIGEQHPALADHLNRTVRTGTYCAYEPDPRAPITWQT